MKREYIPVPYDKTVNEHRAPTDDSIRLLNEMTDKAKRNVLHAIHLKSNIIDCAVVYYRNDNFYGKIDFCLKFDLNGTTHEIDGQIDQHEFDPSGLRHSFGSGLVYDFLVKKYSEEISKMIINQVRTDAFAFINRNDL